MKQRNKNRTALVPVLLSAFLLPCMAKAQTFERSVVGSDGGHFSNSQYTLDYTVGELATQTFTNDDQLSQGFQQVWAITTAVDEAGAEEWTSNVYPNPTIGLLNIETEVPAEIELFDASGRVVIGKNIDIGKSEMNLGGFPAGMYTLSMHAKDSAGMKLFRIIKIE